LKSHLPIIPWLLFISTINTAGCQNLRNAQSLSLFASGLTSPVCIANAGDSRLFVIDQHGLIVIIDSAGIVNPEPFINISDRVVYGGERGLLGIAFHPDYKTNGYFYLNYIGEGDSTHISRFSAVTGHPDKADSLSELNILTLAQPFRNHNGGNLCFGPDGYLYIGLGDGGSSGDPGNRAQNPRELLGKMLRIDVDHGSPYSIPDTNPFYGDTAVANEIWALGLRNPWRYSFDRLTGDLWIGDVGQGETEEIDFQPASSGGGENYGWRCYQGNQAYNRDGCAPVASYIFPVYTYPHSSGCSVTGGYVFRGDPLSPYYGYYFFADYCSDRIWTLHNESGEWIVGDFGRFQENNFSTFGEDSKGQLYIAGLTSGIIYRVTEQLTGIPDEEHPDIKIIQSPSSNKIRIEINHAFPVETRLSICNIWGIILFQAVTYDNYYEIDLNNVPAGMYLLMVRTGGKDAVHKILVGH